MVENLIWQNSYKSIICIQHSIKIIELMKNQTLSDPQCDHCSLGHTPLLLFAGLFFPKQQRHQDRLWHPIQPKPWLPRKVCWKPSRLKCHLTLFPHLLKHTHREPTSPSPSPPPTWIERGQNPVSSLPHKFCPTSGTNPGNVIALPLGQGFVFAQEEEEEEEEVSGTTPHFFRAGWYWAFAASSRNSCTLRGRCHRLH